jgi:hypothetical protein
MGQRVHRLQRAVCGAAALLAASAGPAFGQSEGTVRGRVVAAADGSMLARASVALTPVAVGEPLQAATDASGSFAFQSVRPGEYVLSSSSDGFGSRELRFVLEPREVKTVTLSLDVRHIDVSVDVTASLTTLPGTHSPSSTVLTAETLEYTPVFQRTALSDAIVTAAPGMIRGHDDFVHIRGHEVALSPVINGVTFWENAHALFSSGLSPAVIETANVMTGGFPAEYGNRFGGVVDIVTKSGFGTGNSGTVTLSGGQAGRRSAAGEVGGHRERLGYYLFGSAFGSGRFLSPPDPQAIHDEARGGHLFAQLDAIAGNAGSLRVVVMGDATNMQIPKTPQDLELRPAASADQRTRQQTATLGWTRTWSDIAVASSFYQRWSRLRLLPAAGPLTARARLNRELATIGGKVDVTRFTARHTLKAGVDAVRLRPQEDLAYSYAGYRELTHLLGLPHVHIEGQALAFEGRASGGQVSAFVQDTIQLGARTTANVGLRVDRYSLVASATHASPRLNVAFDLGGGAVLHGSYNRFFVPPPVEGVLSSSAGLTAAIQEIGVALPALEPGVEDQFELGVTAPLRPVRLALTGYYRDTDGPVHTTVWPDSRIYTYASFDRAEAYGLEARADLAGLDRYGVTGYLNYALGRVHFFNPVTGGFVTEADHLLETSRFLAPMDQTHTLTGGFTYRHAATGLWIGTTTEFGSGTPVGHGAGDHAHDGDEGDHVSAPAGGSAERVPGHFTAGLSFGFDLGRGAKRRSRLSLQFNVENLTDNVYLVAREGEFSPAQHSIPRLFSATATVRF